MNLRVALASLGLALVACRDNPSKLDHIAPPAAPATKPTFPLTFDAAAIDKWIASEISERGAIGAAVVVIREGKVVLANGYGKARAGAAEAVTTDTPFAIGSVSKQFLCTVTYMLVDQKRLETTNTIVTWYPDLTRARDITVADLGGHTAGYRDYYPLDYIDERMEKPIAPDDLIAQYAKLPLDFEPGSRWSYSNTGFVILARIVEKVSGMPYAKLLDEWIFKPLAMTATVVRPANAATGHSSFLIEGARPSRLEAEGWLFGAADIWASANDMAKWDLALVGGTLISPDSHRALATARPLTTLRSSGYSCGWFVYNVHDEVVLGHTGWVGGFHTRNAIVPRTQSAVILLTNDEYTDVGGIAYRILELITREQAAPEIRDVPPDVAARDLILALQRGALDRSKLGEDLNAHFDDARIAAAAAKLRDLGAPAVTVTKRGERGGMEVTTLSIAFPTKTLDASMFRSADGKIHQLLFAN
jgi:CubicO group peptidase (beta-lactamase class C family)